MDVQPPSAHTTLLILLGASAWPFSPEFQSSDAFANAARRVKAYFLNTRPFGLPDENVLDLFDADQSADELDVAIGRFLQQRLADMKATGTPARDLLLYFIGHGGFVGRDANFYLAIRRTRMESPRASGIDMMSLADTLTERARHLRRFIILDCCFAAAAFSAFQAGPDQVALEKTADAFKVNQKAVGFPTKGTTLLCSSSHKSPSLLLPDGSSTMFTKAFLDTLVEGITVQQDRLSLRDVKDAAADHLFGMRNAPRPVVLSPDQSEGDVADIPFFPNLWMEKERLQRAEEERKRHQFEEEHVRKEEEVKQPVAESPVPPVEAPSDQVSSLPNVHAAMMPRTSGSSRFPWFFQCSGWALVLSGASGIVQTFLNAFLYFSATDFNNSWWRLDGLLVETSIVLFLLGLPGLHVKQADRVRQFGLVSIVLLFAGNIGVAVYYLLYFSPATNPTIRQYDALFNVSTLLAVVGGILLGIAIVRASIFPRWAAIALMLGSLLLVLTFTPLSGVLGPTFGVILAVGFNTLFCVALVGGGRVLLSRQKVLAVE